MMHVRKLVMFALATLSQSDAALAQGAEWRKFYLNSSQTYCSESTKPAASSKAKNKKEPPKKTPEYCEEFKFNEMVEWDGGVDPPMSKEVTVRARGKTFVVPGSDFVRHRGFSGVERDFVTSSTGALVCESPFKLTEAVQAVGDKAWLQSIGCAKVPAGVPVTLIEPVQPTRRDPWKVRVKLPDGIGVTVWSYYFAFTWPDGGSILPPL